MNDINDRELSLAEEDRLPWLEAVDSDDDDGVSSGKLLGLIGAALLALAVVIGGVWWLRGQKNGPNGDGTLIAAQEGDYKVKPDEVGGMKVEGQGDAAFAASEGAEANGKVDTGSTPEAPISGKKAVPAPASGAGTRSATTSVAGSSALGTGRPVAGPIASPPQGANVAVAAAPGTGLVQLGAYNSEGSANQAWSALAQRHPVLAGLGKSVVPAAIGGATMYRLRVSAGANAASVCAKLKSAGAGCMVVK
jgi:SPOR domain